VRRGSETENKPPRIFEVGTGLSSVIGFMLHPSSFPENKTAVLL
jgi:hypothetical protein